jgi:hypothetical protein
MALGSTQSLTQTSTRDIPWRKRQPVRKANNLTNFMCRLSRHSGSLTLLEPQGPLQACKELASCISFYDTEDLPFCGRSEERFVLLHLSFPTAILLLLSLLILFSRLLGLLCTTDHDKTQQSKANTFMSTD